MMHREDLSSAPNGSLLTVTAMLWVLAKSALFLVVIRWSDDSMCYLRGCPLSRHGTMVLQSGILTMAGMGFMASRFGGTLAETAGLVAVQFCVVVGLVSLPCPDCKQQMRRSVKSQPSWEMVVRRVHKRDAAAGDVQCSICLQSSQEALLAECFCGHVFHERCLRDWMARSGQGCPRRCAPAGIVVLTARV